MRFCPSSEAFPMGNTLFLSFWFCVFPWKGIYASASFIPWNHETIYFLSLCCLFWMLLLLLLSPDVRAGLGAVYPFFRLHFSLPYYSIQPVLFLSYPILPFPLTFLFFILFYLFFSNLELLRVGVLAHSLNLFYLLLFVVRVLVSFFTIYIFKFFALFPFEFIVSLSLLYSGKSVKLILSKWYFQFTFYMRPRISIRGSVRPSVGRSVGRLVGRSVRLAFF